MMEGYSDISDRVQRRARVLLNQWRRVRDSGGRGGENIINMTSLPGMNLVSCEDCAAGIPGLVERISDFGSTSIKLPTSWALALVVGNALRNDRSPVAAAKEHLGLSATSPGTRFNGMRTHTLIERENLLCEWKYVLD